MYKKVEGIVLRTFPYKETSLILTVFTRELGKISIMHRGAKRNNIKLAETELFSLNEYQLYKGKSFYYPNDSTNLKHFYLLRENENRLILASYILELLNFSLLEEELNKEVYDLTVKGLEYLSNLEKDFIKFILAFEIKFISLIGYMPQLLNCTHCKKDLKEELYFSNSQGGVLCENCRVDVFDSYIMRNRENEILYRFLYSKFEELEKLEVDESLLFKIHGNMIVYIQEKIEKKEFNSLKFYKHF